jgi:hypothetical protein
MFSCSIPEGPVTLANEMLTVMQWTAMPLRFLVLHLVVAMATKKGVVLHLIKCKSDRSKLKGQVVSETNRNKF